MVKTGARRYEGAAAPTESVRDRILNTARELFYREGARSVGVDTVVAQSGVAKTSLYRWFPSKDALIVAVIEAERRIAGRVGQHRPAQPGRSARPIARSTRRHGQVRQQPEIRGCPFMNVTVEFADHQHPARLLALEEMEELRRRLRGLVDQIGVRKPALVTEQM